jgi:hypothetical protein
MNPPLEGKRKVERPPSSNVKPHIRRRQAPGLLPGALFAKALSLAYHSLKLNKNYSSY